MYTHGMNFELSIKQKNIIKDILDWYKEKKIPYLTLGGYAGTGKTTILGYLNEKLHKEYKDINIAYCSYTGKASQVLRKKLQETGSLKRSDYVGTIHRLIYKAIVDEDDNIIGWEKISVDDFEYDLIIVDEASMVSSDIWQDLLSFEKPILAVGDHGQLPPVEGKFNLMLKPMLRLEEIYRQEKDNPIVVISEMARKYGEIPKMEYGRYVKKFSREDEDVMEFLTDQLSSYNENMMVLVGYNHTRNKINDGIRQLLEFESPQPQIEDRVICLRNNAELGIFNGMIGTIQSIEKVSVADMLEYYQTDIIFDGEDEVFHLPISIEQFRQRETLRNVSRDINLFDFGYALTVHKAQGSQAEKVILFEERFSKMDDDMWRRWLYTGVTRAVSELYIIGQ
jgi:exodeoxyribonuclease-5